MAIIKCKMCGGDLEITADSSVATCEYCGTQQTVPTADNEKKLTLFGRAGRLLRGCEFDKASGVYESIVAEFPEEAEAYWGLVLCKYGIEYVDDPATAKKIPTCHRSSFDSVMDDSNLEQALENADSMARKVYREEAKAIEELRKSIIEVSGKEEPYDIFICYKETEADGGRTIDSVIAQDVYDALTEKGYRVFFSRITLEDKLGQEYEPYIFAALHSAKVMLAFGTDYEYYNAVWVKNEWSRFLQLIAAGEKKTLIPCYKGIDAYDMPKEFARLQAQDMGKVGAIQDLLRGIEKILPRVQSATTESVVVQQSGNGSATAALLKRAFMFLEDGAWESADEYCEKVLDFDPECAEAYLARLMSALRIRKRECLKDCAKPFDDNFYYKKAIRFGSETLKAELSGYLEHIDLRNKTDDYNHAKSRMEKANSVDKYQRAAELFVKLGEFKDAVAQAEECRRCAKECRYNHAKSRMEEANSADEYQKAAELFVRLGEFKDAVAQAEECRRCASIAAAEEAHRQKVECEEKARAMEEKARLMARRIKIAQKYGLSERVSISQRHAVGLKSNGTVVAVGKNDFGQCNVSGWRDIVAVAASNYHTVGLKSDGTVVAVGNNEFGQCAVSHWRDIVAIATGIFHTVGLKSDGTVVAVGSNKFGQCAVSHWRDIITITATTFNTVGLKSDGTVVAIGRNEYGQCNVSDWHDIVAIESYTDLADHYLDSNMTNAKVGRDKERQVSGWRGVYAISSHTVGLRSDGTVVAVGLNEYGECNVSNWTDIVAIAVTIFGTVGLKSDGTAVAAGNNDFYKCNVSHWLDVVAISGGCGLKSDGTVVCTNNGYYGYSGWTDIVALSSGDHTMGLKSNGTVVYNGHEKWDVRGWKLFGDIDHLEQERLAGQRKSLAAELSALTAKEKLFSAEQASLQAELSTLKGLFSGGRRREIEARLAEIAKQLEQIPVRVSEIETRLQVLEREIAEANENSQK